MTHYPTAILALAHLGTAYAQTPPPDLEIEDEAAPSVEAPVTPAGPTPAELELRATIDALRARLEAVEARPIPEPPAPPPPPPEPPPAGVVVSGYTQAQLVHAQLSQDELSPDGGALNQDRFLVRRARLHVQRDFDFARAVFEIDANTARGPFVSVRRAEVTAFVAGESPDALPIVEVSAGLQEIPFGYEMTEGHRARWFAERTTGSNAFFRGEPDVGVSVGGALGPLRYALALQNGVPLDDRPGAVTSVFTHQKTTLGRVGFETSQPERFALAGGVSWLAGTGFHGGSAETKSHLSWRDLNQDGNVTLNELLAAQGQAATPSQTFGRWGVNGDLEVGVHTPLGWSRLEVEGTMASNLDRGLFVADPLSTGYDVRETAWKVALLQDVTEYAIVGFRADRYDPNTDLFDTRRGLFIPADASIFTLSPLIGANLKDVGRLLFQYDYVVDHLGRDTRGEPVDVANDQWTLRAQVQF